MLYVISHIFSISSVGLWAILANRWGKKTVWGIAMGLLITGMFGSGLLSPNHTSQVVLLLCLIPFYCGFAAVMVIAPSLLSDIIDYSTWKFKRERGATFFSFYMLMLKTNIAIGGAVGMALAGWYGFDASATAHSVDSAFGLRLGVAWLPIPFLLLSLFFIVRMPINMRRHAIVRRALDRRLNRASKQSHGGNQHLTRSNHQANVVHST
uniref:MFS transporter n=1 Tax=Flavobacterium sp. TaxID=239 RepID=UPI0040472047